MKQYKLILIFVLLLLIIIVNGCKDYSCSSYGEVIYDGEKKLATSEEAEELFWEYKPYGSMGHFSDYLLEDPEEIDSITKFQGKVGGQQKYYEGWIPEPYGNLRVTETGKNDISGILIGSDGKVYMFKKCI